jgi:hypothetical protein
MTVKANERLITLYKNIADITFQDCKVKCRRLGSCCEPMYCEIAIAFAKDTYGIELEQTGNKIPLLRDGGTCVAEPHLRGMCSMHSCDINSVGFFKGNPQLTNQYFEVRDEIESIEMQDYANRCSSV